MYINHGCSFEGLQNTQNTRNSLLTRIPLGTLANTKGGQSFLVYFLYLLSWV